MGRGLDKAAADPATSSPCPLGPEAEVGQGSLLLIRKADKRSRLRFDDWTSRSAEQAHIGVCAGQAARVRKIHSVAGVFTRIAPQSHARKRARPEQAGILPNPADAGALGYLPESTDAPAARTLCGRRAWNQGTGRVS